MATTTLTFETSRNHQESVVPSWLDRDLYPFPSRVCRVSAGGIHYVDEGAGEPIVFVHGTPSWSFEFRHVILALRGSYRCIAPDLMGFGLSDRPLAFPYTPEAHADALREFVDAIGLERFALVVHDFGGPIALPLALAGRVTRLVVINSWMWPLDEPRLQRQARFIGGPVGRWLYEYANISLRVLMPSAFGRRAALTPRIHRQYLAPFRNREDRGRVLHALARALTTSRDHYADLWSRRARLMNVPTLLLWGVRDPAFGEQILARWQQALPHASVRRTSAGHWPHEEQPDAVRAALEEFFHGR